MEDVTLNIKLIDGFEPYNDLFFKNCFHIALFSILKHFNRNIDPFFYNEAFHYQYDEKNSVLSFNIQTIKDRQAIFNEDLGIIENNKPRSDNIISDIITSIKDNKPVLIFVDRFYQSIIPLYYQKKHNTHTLLLYGFDEEKKIFNTIEDFYMGENSKYVKCNISFEDVEKSYNGFLEYYIEYKDYPSFYSYSVSSENYNFSDEKLSETKLNYINTLKFKKDLMYDSLNCINLFRNKLKELLDSNKFLEKIPEFEIMIWWIIQFRNSEKYILSQISGDSSILTSFTNVIDSWEYIKTILIKIYVINHCNAKLIKDLFDKFDQISLIEKKSYDSLFAQV